MSKTFYEENLLYFPNNHLVTLPAKIPKDEYLLQAYDRCFVINNIISKTNIWCFDLEGNKLWEIEPSVWERPYFQMKLDEKHGLLAWDQNGDCYKLDENTGKVSILRADRFGPIND